jgi:hypothetical protein
MVTFNELAEIHDIVYRNIIGINLEFDEFDDLTQDVSSRQYAHRVTDSLNKSDAQYHAIDYIFNLSFWEPSRFGTGAYPVWYASRDLVTSFYETLPRYKKTFLMNPNFKEIPEIVPILRSVFIVQCDAALIDLRKKINKYPELVNTDPLGYRVTQEVGVRVHREGYPGLLTQSARNLNGETVAVFRKNILTNAKHFQNYIYEYNLKNNTEQVKAINTGKIILEK